ncbi:MAG TPA: TetR/AcrR family transcriptional regulator [Pirellulales bacterium]|jgi:AcrR family transcriptional regulator|nr:TetR/AcrR family transcriptional regulator [Pirellulales bacterium]
MAGSSKTLPDRTRDDARAVEIYTKAAHIFHERGYDATSMNDLADALNITKAGLYYYIESKEDLLFQIMSYALDWLEREVIEPARSITDPHQRLLTIIRLHGAALVNNSRALPVLTDEVAALSPKHRREINARKHRYLELVRDTLEALRQQGKLRDIDSTVAAFSLFGMLLWLPRWFKPAGARSASEVLDDVAALYFGGVLK